MSRTVAEKLGAKPQMRVYFVNAPEHFMADAQIEDIDLKTRLSGSFDYIHYFSMTQKEFPGTFVQLKAHLKPDGMLWVSWPKSGQYGTDLNIKNVIKMGYDAGMVESKTISVNEKWSAIKFTFPKKGKEYINSYGKLP